MTFLQWAGSMLALHDAIKTAFLMDPGDICFCANSLNLTSSAIGVSLGNAFCHSCSLTSAGGVLNRMHVETFRSVYVTSTTRSESVLAIKITGRVHFRAW